MQQILQQLQQGTTEVVKDNGDGTLITKVNPPSALQLRAARLIVQIINERDQVVTSNQSLAHQMQQILNENENLKRQLKESNELLNSRHVSQTDTRSDGTNAGGSSSDGKNETPRSEAS